MVRHGALGFLGLFVIALSSLLFLLVHFALAFFAHVIVVVVVIFFALALVHAAFSLRFVHFALAFLVHVVIVIIFFALALVHAALAFAFLFAHFLVTVVITVLIILFALLFARIIVHSLAALFALGSSTQTILIHGQDANGSHQGGIGGGGGGGGGGRKKAESTSLALNCREGKGLSSRAEKRCTTAWPGSSLVKPVT